MANPRQFSASLPRNRRQIQTRHIHKDRHRKQNHAHPELPVPMRPPPIRPQLPIFRVRMRFAPAMMLPFPFMHEFPSLPLALRAALAAETPLLRVSSLSQPADGLFRSIRGDPKRGSPAPSMSCPAPGSPPPPRVHPPKLRIQPIPRRAPFLFAPSISAPPLRQKAPRPPVYSHLEDRKTWPITSYSRPPAASARL